MWIRALALTRITVAFGLACLVAGALSAQDISPAAQVKIGAIIAARNNFTDVQKKIDSNLLFAAMASRHDTAVSSFADIVPAGTPDPSGNIIVDIKGEVTDSLLNAVTAAGGVVLSESARWGMIHASLPLGAIETVAAHADTRSIRQAPRMRANGQPSFRRVPRAGITPSSIVSLSRLDLIGAVTSQGYITQSANLVVANQGITGAGVTVGVLSDSASPSRIAALIATGDLPAGTTSLPGQAIPDGGGGADEGTALMEIVHDIAPGARLIFATAFNGEISFANNIIALQQAGCKVIVDDTTYADEAVFEDGPIAQAITQVTAAGVIYFSAAGFEGNLTLGTSGTWEGDFVSGGPVAGVIVAPYPQTGSLHNFGTLASPQNYDVLLSAAPLISLEWSDPLGLSSNGYDLFVLSAAGTTVLGYSISSPNGTQDPYDVALPILANSTFPAGSRIVVVQQPGSLRRALHIHTWGARLSIGTSGATYGHHAALNTVSVAATYWNSGKTGTRAFTGAANPVETFSSDGPRRIFYNPNGSILTPSVLFSENGGISLQKPDLTATDGVNVKTPGFSPFFGTSAAAAHAAAIAALILQVRPAYTPAQIKTAMLAGTLDNMAPGVDRDSGYGIVMATLAVQYALAH